MEALVLGAGVIGLSTAIRLMEHRLSVTLWARDFPPNTTSDTAAAVWYPFQSKPDERTNAWLKKSFDRYRVLARDAASGVVFHHGLEFFQRSTPDPPWADIVDEFQHVQAGQLPAGFVDGYALIAPVIDTSIHMEYLVDWFDKLGGRREARELQDLHPALTTTAKVIINCTGLGARELCDDQRISPIRGQVVRVAAPEDQQFWFDQSGQRPRYAIPRGHDCILGGTTEKNDWSTEVDPATTELIVESCAQIRPEYADLDIIESWVGLRPGRDRVRLESMPVDDDRCLIHNYGHGGSGFTLAWGCAEDVVRLVLDWLE